MLVALAVGLVLAGASPHRVGQAGVTLVLPGGWSSVPLVLPPPDGNDPVTRIVIASTPIRFGQCNDISYRFAATGVAIVVLEYRTRTVGSFPPRPRHFHLSLQQRLDCHVGRGGSVQFTDHARRFDAFILLGPRASATLGRRALRVLDTLRVR